MHLKKTNAKALSSAFYEQQEQVIASFGGLANMVELCLTNQSINQQIDNDHDPKQFNSLNNILDDINISHGNVNKVENKQKQQNDESRPDNIDGTKQIQTISSAIEYYHHALIIDCDPTNSALFRFFSNNMNKATSIYNAILHKRIIFAFACLVIGINGLEWGREYISFLDAVYIIFKIFSCILSLVYCVAVMSIANTTMIDLITNTFDFMFKLYNTIILLVATWIRWHGTLNIDVNSDEKVFNALTSTDEFVAEIFFHVGFIVTVSVYFLMDAIPLSITFKRIANIVFIIFSIYNTLYDYFIGKDYQWNPFDFKYRLVLNQLCFHRM